jgi:hypothetical protein
MIGVLRWGTDVIDGPVFLEVVGENLMELDRYSGYHPHGARPEIR